MHDFFVLASQSIALRLGLAFVAGSLIGLERENHGRAAGLRTTALVCVASAIAMLLSEYFFTVSRQWVEASGRTGAWGPDLARLPAGILAGMGFLGAGAIMKEGRIVRGVTTAAALWFASVLGLVFGAGDVILGLYGLAVAMLTLHVLPYMEGLIHNDWYASVIVTMRMEGLTDGDLRRRIESMGVAVKNVELEYDRPQQRRIVACRVKYKRSDGFDLAQRVVQDIMTCDGVDQVKWV